MSDESVSIAIKCENGKVVSEFSRQIDTWVCDPSNMLTICEALAAAAFEAQGDVKPVGPALKAQLVEKHRDKLIPRVALMLGSLRHDKLKSDGYIAEQIVSTMLAEVF